MYPQYSDSSNYASVISKKGDAHNRSRDFINSGLVDWLVGRLVSWFVEKPVGVYLALVDFCLVFRAARLFNIVAASRN